MQFRINLDNEKLEMFNEEVSFYHFDFMISFLGVNIQKDIDNFTFTYTLTDVEDDTVVKSFDGNLNDLYNVLSKNGGLHIVERVGNLLPNTHYALQIVCNYAAKESVYDLDITTVFPPKQYNSWVWNQTTLSWEAPIEYPNDGFDYEWDEIEGNWVLAVIDNEES